MATNTPTVSVDAIAKLAWYNLTSNSIVPQISKTLTMLTGEALATVQPESRRVPQRLIDEVKSRPETGPGSIPGYITQSQLYFTGHSRPSDANIGTGPLAAYVHQCRYFVRIPNILKHIKLYSRMFLDPVESENRYSAHFGRVPINGRSLSSSDTDMALAIPLVPSVTARFVNDYYYGTTVRCQISDYNSSQYATQVNGAAAKWLTIYPIIPQFLVHKIGAGNLSDRCILMNQPSDALIEEIQKLDRAYFTLDNLEAIKRETGRASAIKALMHNPVFLQYYTEASRLLENGNISVPDNLLAGVVDYSLFSNHVLNSQAFFSQTNMKDVLFSHQQPRYTFRYL